MDTHHALVTGGGGFLGKAVVKKLLGEGWCVRSFSRSFYPELDRLGVEQIQGDLSDFTAVEKAVKGVASVFHTAAKPDLFGPYSAFYKANVKGTANVIAACQKHEPVKLIHTSSPSVVFDDNDMENADESVPYPEKYLAHYPKTKAMAKKLVLEAARQGLAAIIIRPHLIWGPEDPHIVPGIIKRAKSLKRVGRLDDLVDTIYVDNAADALLLAEKKLSKDPGLSGNIYFISQDDPVSKWALADAFLAAAGKGPIQGHVSAGTAYAAGAVFEIIYRLFRMKKDPPMTRFAAKELATSHWFDISRAKQDLGYSPAVTTSEGLKRLKQWLQKIDLESYLNRS